MRNHQTLEIIADHADFCHKCDTAYECVDVFNADKPVYEYYEDGVMIYRPLGRYALIVWPKGWRKYNDPDGVYPIFNIYRKGAAVFNFLDHANTFSLGMDVISKRDLA